MHNQTHTEKTKEKMRLAKLGKPTKWGHLPELEIVNRLLDRDTTRSIAKEYGCSDSTIKIIFRKHTSKEQRMEAKNRKQGLTLRNRPNPFLGKWRQENDVWTGRKHTEKARQKQSQAKRGRKQPLAQRIAQSARMQGIPVTEWRAFKSTEYERLKGSLEYVTWRKAIFERDSYTCQNCGIKGGCGRRVLLHPHHIKSKARYPEFTLDVNNGITLCHSCHKKTESYGVSKIKTTNIPVNFRIV